MFLPDGRAAAETLTEAEETAAKGLLAGAGATPDRKSTNVTGAGHSHLRKKENMMLHVAQSWQRSLKM